MDQADLDDSVWRQARRFADRHIRAFALGLCLLAIPVSLALLAPSILVAAATPLTAPVRLKATISVTYLDKDGKVIGRQGPVAGRYVRLSQIPAYLPQAILAMEDRRFYAHHGIDLLGLSRAAYSDLRARRFVAGGSTISQQTAKLLFTDGSRTFRRKLHELVNAVRLEKSFSKDQILEIYLNRIYLGEGTFGVDSAARNYFGVSAANLSLSQAAMLAGLTRAPTLYSPRRNLALAQKRARLVLATMVETGAVSNAAAQAAMAHPAQVIADHPDDHDYVLDAAAAEVQKLVTGNDIPARALMVHTTIDSALQAQAQDIVQRSVAKAGPKLGFTQAALVLMTPGGDILSLVGGTDYRTSVFNRATQAHRQPGSAFKPFVYLAALERGITPWELREDQPVDIAGYQPANYQNASFGQLRLIDALARSVNTITVNLAQEVGVTNVASAARRLGIVSPLHDNASLALGTDEVTPLELTAAYAAFANGGKRASPHLVASLTDANGTTLFQRREPEAALVVSDPVRRDMTAMLSRVLEAGTGTAARLPRREAAGKTGTTQDYRDAWFVGFTAQHVAGIWIGNDDNRPMRKVTGGTVPAQMWKQVMLAAEAQQPATPLDRSPTPPEIKSEQIAAPAYLDDPMQGSTFVEAAATRLPEIPAPSEPAPPLTGFQSVPAAAPALMAEQPTPPRPEEQNTRIPLTALPENPPSANPADAQALYRQRQEEYRRQQEEYRRRQEEYLRVLRQATSPGPYPDGAPRPPDADGSSYRELPFPR
jgi:penicillin-binding protein 1A